MGILGIEKVDKKKKGTFFKGKGEKQVDNLTQMDRVILDKKAYEDLKKAQEEELLKAQAEAEQQRMQQMEEQKRLEQEYIQSLDPLNNANNPIPVNPVAPVEEVIEKEKLGFGGIIKMVLGMVFKPGDVLDEKPDKYGTIDNGLKLTLILTLIFRVIAGMFIKSDVGNVFGSVGFDFDNVFMLEYSYYLVTAVIISGVCILVVSLIYYLSSFFNNKGVSFGEYLIITSLSFIPFLFGYSVLLPVGSIFSSFIGYILLGVTVIYTLVSFISGINQALTFSSVNRKIIYNTFNLSVIFIAIAIIVYFIYFSGLINISNSIIPV